MRHPQILVMLNLMRPLQIAGHAELDSASSFWVESSWLCGSGGEPFVSLAAALLRYTKGSPPSTSAATIAFDVSNGCCMVVSGGDYQFDVPVAVLKIDAGDHAGLGSFNSLDKGGDGS